METLIEIGREKGLRSIYGTDNDKMLTLVKELDFSIGANSDGEVKITRQL